MPDISSSANGVKPKNKKRQQLLQLLLQQQQLQQLQLQMQQIGGHRTASYYRYNCYSKKYIILYI